MCSFDYMQPITSQFANMQQNLLNGISYLEECGENFNENYVEPALFASELVYAGACELSNYLGRGVADWTNENLPIQIAIIAQRVFDSFPVVAAYFTFPAIPNILMIAGGIAVDHNKCLSDKTIRNITTGYAIATAFEAAKEVVLFGMTSDPKHIAIAAICVFSSAYFFHRAQLVSQPDDPRRFIPNDLGIRNYGDLGFVSSRNQLFTDEDQKLVPEGYMQRDPNFQVLDISVEDESEKVYEEGELPPSAYVDTSDNPGVASDADTEVVSDQEDV